jgi:mannan endo-1,4-beta-mannosidase
MNFKRIAFFVCLLNPIWGSCQKEVANIAISTNKLPNGQSASTKLEDRTPKGIVKYFDRLIKDSLIVVGQACYPANLNTSEGYKTYFENLYTQTGKYPALLGLHYSQKRSQDTTIINQLTINHWQKGGLVTVGMSFNNPFFEGSDGSSAIDYSKIDLKKLLSSAPDSKEKTAYRNQLIFVSKALLNLKKAGVVVIWRPFHEMNGNWFWWGLEDAKKTAKVNDYHLLWQDMHKTFTQMGLDNLIWVFAPSNPWNQDVRNSLALLYPGNDYVDIVGMSIYKAPLPDFVENYATLKQFSKTIVIAECGDDIDNQGDKVLDEMDMLRKYRGKAGYFLQWASWQNSKLNVLVRRAIIDNPNAKEMMNHRWAVTLDEIK